MFENILDVKRLSLLKTLTALDELDGFYLAGGTALSLQLGLRVSVDFDFFTPHHFNADVLYNALKAHFNDVRAIDIVPDTCNLLIEDVRVSFFGYPYPMVESLVQGSDALSRLRMASPSDIAAMKLSAIGSRGSRKDFYDLYQIYHRVPGFDGKKLLCAARAKFGQEKDLTYMLMGLSYFDDAEQEELTQIFVKADWNEIKQFFIEEQARLFDSQEAQAREGMI